ncbi:MAG: ABC transporter ATP-binding protein [Tannerella sp.]|jgi:ABC-2 type transport system ATP-binding protein|nr:ABC transporter ATP-binding protein [Tannerella sp.]
MIVLDNVGIEYTRGKPVINGLSYTMNGGEIHGIVGSNGVGKTTLLHALSGLLPFKGSIMHDGLTLRNVAFLQADPYFYPHLLGAEYLGFFQALNPKSHIHYRTLNKLFELPLDQKMYVEHYSTGMKKKLALMAVILQDRDVIILDEPFNGIDLVSNILISKLLKSLSQKGNTIIITSHILSVLTDISHSVLWLHHGNVYRTYKREQFKNIETEIIELELADKSHILNEIILT